MSSDNAVSGQVAATATEEKHGFPPDVDLAKVVFPLPQQVNSKYMTDTDGVTPVSTAGNLIKLFINHSQDLFKRNGNLAIVDKAHTPYAGGLKFVERKRFMKDRIYVLLDANDKPIALTVEDGASDAVNACIIYSAKPLTDSPVHESVLLKEDDITFYPWFRVVDDHPAYTSIDYWEPSGKYQPFLRAHPDKEEHAVGLLIKSASGNHTLGHLVKMKKEGGVHGWDVTIAPGVDPCMMICITAAMEDLFGGKHFVF